MASRVLELQIGYHYVLYMLSTAAGRIEVRVGDTNASYRAMHFSAKRGIAIACRLSVCL